MHAIQLRTLHPDDAERLLLFERENRAWFERHIASRGDAFYSPEGVREHIEAFLDAHRAGRLHPCLLLGEDGAVLGRVNLKDIDAARGTAEVGYRIAQAQAGKGLATAALPQLIALARSRWHLARLVAYVSAANPASARVLEKCGFARERDCPDEPGVQRFFLDLEPFE